MTKSIGDKIKCKVCNKEITKLTPRHIYCEKCRYGAYAESTRVWGIKHREYRNMCKRTWYEKNREYVRTYNRRYKRRQRARQSEESGG